MSMLTIIASVCARQNVPVPATAYGTTDPQVKQMIALLEEEGDDLQSRGTWQSLTNEASLTTVATVSQGAIATIATNGFDFIKNETIWDRTNKLPIWGPLSDKEWQARQALAPTGPRYQYRIRGGLLLVNPVPTAGYSWYFEYVTKNWITDSTGVTQKAAFTADTDLVLFSEKLVKMGLRWRWMREKGMDYAELFRMYEEQVKNALGRDGGKQTLYQDNDQWRGSMPGVFVPQGSWSL